MFLFPDFLPVDGSNLAFIPVFASHPFMGPTPPSLPSLAETFQFWSRLASLWRSVLGVPPSLGKYCAKSFMCLLLNWSQQPEERQHYYSCSRNGTLRHTGDK